ncbi:S-layer homology domain-containing protein [Oscillibacter sp.]|uniref:S-layer homology domain-containing protein n=1 Tax=Oscillibacter sp. TaxID=1945593 RepID=UPI001B782590|nr:S-layer homology domain-containing protein [Oscillibacter sp.]MBP3509352.1 S-layer homology domain-containing protein [Oscillibacter sp.]
MKKRILSVLLCLCMVMALLPTTALADSFTVTYDANGGTGALPEPAGTDAGGTFALPESPNLTKGTDIFIGWTDGANSYLPGATYTMPAKNVTLKALWTNSNPHPETEVEISNQTLNGTNAYYHNGTSTNLAGTADSAAAGASAYFKDGVLVLNGLNVNNGQIKWEGENSETANDDLIIVLLSGSVNTVTNTSGSAIVGRGSLFEYGPCLTIRTSGDATATLYAIGKSSGLWVWKDTTIEGHSKVIAQGNEKYGIAANAYTNGSSTAYSVVTIKDNADVKAVGGSYGISADNSHQIKEIKINGGKLLAQGGTQAMQRGPTVDSGITSSSGSYTDHIYWIGTTSADRAAKPTAAFTATSATSGVLSGVTTDMQYKLGYSDWVKITSDMLSGGAITLTDLPNSGLTISVQNTNGMPTTDDDSDVQVITPDMTVPTYGISLNKSGTQNFAAKTVGYTESDLSALEVTVTNTGINATGPLTVALSGANADSFTLSTDSISSIGTASGSNTAQFTVVPKTGLSADTYTATVAVSGNDISKTFKVNFTVDPLGVLKTVTFGYAYDVQRDPAYPKAGQNITFSGLRDPKAGGGPSGSWTLTKISTYSAMKAEHPELDFLVQNFVVQAYGSALNKDTIVIHELKNNGTHVDYGVVTAYDAANGYAAFIGGSFGYGYLLSKNQKNTVPSSDTVTVTAGSITDGSLSYTVTFDPNGGTVSPTSASVSAGGTLSSLPTPTHSGSYSFVGWYTAPTGGTQVTTSSVFNSNTTIYAQWTYTGGSYTPSIDSDDDDEPTYKVESEVSKDADGTVSVKPSTAEQGDKVTITVTPDRYYKVDDVVIKDQNGKVIPVTDNKDGTFTFKMPSSKVTVEPIFSWDNPFADVAENAYYASAVEWALKNDITNGSGDASFSPDTVCTRVQIVTFLWRAAGCPEPAGTNSFTDVSADAYYAKAVAWAVEQGITNGTGGGKFSPDAACTRAQVVAFLWRAEGSDAAGTANSFADVPANAYYTDAVNWAVENSITGGTSATTFSPAVNCTRAQIVTFLYRDMVE